MLLEEDVVMERDEEIGSPSRPIRDNTQPPPAPRDEDDQQASDETPPWRISPPPMPWPRVFPSL
jgi:hypothetical protein